METISTIGELARTEANAITPFGIFFVMAIRGKRHAGQRAAVRKEASRNGCRTYGRFVAGGRDNTALVGPAADDHGLPRGSWAVRIPQETKKASMSTWRMEESRGSSRSSVGSCLARKRARSGMLFTVGGKKLIP